MKYMTFNASCSYAGVANILETYGFDTEDRQIALDMGLPFLFGLQDGICCAGPMLQSAEWFNLYLHPNGFHMTETRLPRRDVPAFLGKTDCAMLGIRVPSGGKHAIVYTGRTAERENGNLQEAEPIQKTKEPSWSFINNRHKESAEPDTFCFGQEELLQRLEDFVTIAALQKTNPVPVDKKPYFRNSIRILLQLQDEIAAFCSKEQPPQALRAARDTLFRPILLDGITMLGLLGNTELKAALLSIQRDFLAALRENRPVILAKRLSLPDLRHAVSLYAELIDEQAKEASLPGNAKAPS